MVASEALEHILVVGAGATLGEIGRKVETRGTCADWNTARQ